MGNLGGQEILVILLVGLIVLGPTKLPAAVRQAGRFAAEARRMATGFKRELQDALEEPLAESRATLQAADPRVKATPPRTPTPTSTPPLAAPPQTPTPTSTPPLAAPPQTPTPTSTPAPTEDSTDTPV